MSTAILAELVKLTRSATGGLVIETLLMTRPSRAVLASATLTGLTAWLALPVALVATSIDDHR